MQNSTVQENLTPSATAERAQATQAGIRVPRHFTKAGVNPLDEVKWDKRRTVIANPDGSVVFEMNDGGID